MARGTPPVCCPTSVKPPRGWLQVVLDAPVAHAASPSRTTAATKAGVRWKPLMSSCLRCLSLVLMASCTRPLKSPELWACWSRVPQYSGVWLLQLALCSRHEGDLQQAGPP